MFATNLILIFHGRSHWWLFYIKLTFPHRWFSFIFRLFYHFILFIIFFLKHIILFIFCISFLLRYLNFVLFLPFWTVNQIAFNFRFLIMNILSWGLVLLGVLSHHFLNVLLSIEVFDNLSSLFMFPLLNHLGRSVWAEEKNEHSL